MTTIQITEEPRLEGMRRAFVLAEDRVGHYPEFRDFFVRIFDLDRVGLAKPGYIVAPSGLVYALVFVGRSGEGFPAGLEIYALVSALEPLEESTVDRDLWAILRWMIDGVGGKWSLADLDATGRLLRIPAALP
ncbi:MAG TPA: hypothetical protein VEK55_13235 [Xanthobacteraceae bacterium]|nr:hypothetical protein [Xanthobacteraceae bacterium]